MLTKIILYIKNHLRSTILGVFGVIMLAVFFNLFSIAMHKPEPIRPSEKKEKLSEEMRKLQHMDSIQMQKVRNQVAKRLALDSLVDNKIFTPENIAIVDSIYPDSICDCAYTYHFDDTTIYRSK